MNQCPLCKITFPDEQVFCSECGAKLVPVQQEQKREEKEQKDPKPAKAKSAKAPVIVLAVLLIAALVGDGYFYSQTSNYRDRYWAANGNLRRTETELKEAEAELERYSDLSGVYGYASDNYYADKSVLVIKESETASVTIHFGYTGSLSMKASSGSISGEWSDWSDTSTITASFTGESAGFYTVNFTNNQNDESFDILIIVQS